MWMICKVVFVVILGISLFSLDCDIAHKLTREFFKIEIYFPGEIHEEYHYAFLKNLTITKSPPNEQINVILILFDSLSNAYAKLSMKKTYKAL